MINSPDGIRVIPLEGFLFSIGCLFFMGIFCIKDFKSSPLPLGSLYLVLEEKGDIFFIPIWQLLHSVLKILSCLDFLMCSASWQTDLHSFLKAPNVSKATDVLKRLSVKRVPKVIINIDLCWIFFVIPIIYRMIAIESKKFFFGENYFNECY
ncbi:MAG: hypothetical protein VX495_02615 [Nitrospinota bacterium]|nr:hypothetical protein [Nitrospinota bacterium]